jgi:hypothetical protein
MTTATLARTVHRLKALAAQLSGQRSCPVCKDWPPEFVLAIREVVIEDREQAARGVEQTNQRDPWLDGCPSCGFRPMLLAIELEREEHHG